LKEITTTPAAWRILMTTTTVAMISMAQMCCRKNRVWGTDTQLYVTSLWACQGFVWIMKPCRHSKCWMKLDDLLAASLKKGTPKP